MTQQLKWRNKQSGYEFRGELHLSWEVHGDPMSDDYSGADDIAAVDLLRRWTDQYYPEAIAETLYGPGAVKIHWSIAGEPFEAAPFSPDVWMLDDEEDFLTFFTWPTNPETGDRLNFNTLPVKDKVWNDQQWDKGGFIQEATGWKPSPFQPVMYVPTVFAAAGLGHLAPLTQREIEPLHEAAKKS